MKTIKITENQTELEKHVIEWLNDKVVDYDGNMKAVISDLLSHGCVSGMVGHLIAYVDTNEFYSKYEEDIWDLLEEGTESFGNDNIVQFIGSLNGAKDVGSLVQFKNLLAWFAFEETARKIADNNNIED